MPHRPGTGSEHAESESGKSILAGILGISTAAAATLIAIAEDPGTWFRQQLVDVVLSGFEGLFVYLVMVGGIITDGFYTGVWVPVSNLGGMVETVFFLPFRILEDIGLSILASAGLAAPFAVLIVQFTAVLFTVALWLMLWSFAKTYLPVDGVAATLRTSLRSTVGTAIELVEAIIPGSDGGNE